MNSGYLPLGADSENAPFNQSDNIGKCFDVCASQTLSKNTEVWTDKYVSDEEVNVDEDGSESVKEIIDTSDTDWKEVYGEQHLTPAEIIQCCKALAQKVQAETQRIEVPGLGQVSVKQLVSECEEWIVDEFEVIHE